MEQRDEAKEGNAADAAQALYIGRVDTRSGALNVRQAPGGSVIGQIERGAEAPVLGEEGQWLQIAYGGGIGYVSRSFMAFAKHAEPAARLIIEDDEGNVFIPKGGFSVKMALGPID